MTSKVIVSGFIVCECFHFCYPEALKYSSSRYFYVQRFPQQQDNDQARAAMLWTLFTPEPLFLLTTPLLLAFIKWCLPTASLYDTKQKMRMMMICKVILGLKTFQGDESFFIRPEPLSEQQ